MISNQQYKKKNMKKQRENNIGILYSLSSLINIVILKREILLTIICAGLLLLSSSCSTTKNLPKDEVLYTGIKKINIFNEPNKKNADKKEIKEAEYTLNQIESALSCPPNNALLGSSSIRIPFPFGLWIYNGFINKKGKINRWIFNRFSTDPVLISKVNPEIRSTVARNLLQEYGYFRGETSYMIDYNPKNHKKAKITYNVTMNAPFRYDSIAYINFNTHIYSLVQENIGNTLLHKGDIFNVNQLESERKRISSLLRNNGFYYFRPDFITYDADTIMNPGKVALHISTRSGLPEQIVTPWKIGDISIRLNGYNNEPPTDSLKYKNLTIWYEKKLRVRPKVLYDNIRFKPGDLYTQNQQEKTQTDYARLGIFRYSEIQYIPKDTLSTCDTLDVLINSVYDLPLDGELEFNVTTKSNDQTGPGAVFSVTKRNVFGGGEIFNVSMRGSYEWQTGRRVTGNTGNINSWELGMNAGLTFPHVIFPRIYKEDTKYPSSTTFKIYVDQLNQAKFFRILAFGGSSSYDFQPTATSHHSVIPFKLTYSLLQRTTHDFDSITQANPALKRSLDNQFIPAIGYVYTYDDSPITSKVNHLWFQGSITQAGNILDAAYAIAGKHFNKKDKTLFGNKFAQFVKMTGEVRYNYYLGKGQHLVGRIMTGVALSYGNSNTIPYVEQFYIGGANSIRAFTVRSIGPGSYHPADSKYGYLYETGDLKFEANLEYRFPILGDLHGAFFLDSGNIWLLRDDPATPGGKFKWKNFFKELAVGTGMGLRYDLSFLVVRLDWGIGLHVPFKTDKKGYYNIPDFRDGNGLHLAVGYPF